MTNPISQMGKITGGYKSAGMKKAEVKKEARQMLDVGERFTPSEKAELPKKIDLKLAAKSRKASREDFGIADAAAPAAQSAISSPGGPLFKSIAGSIAKWLISDKQEIKLGEMLAQQVESRYPISRDPALNARVNRIGKQIAANSKRPNLPWTFKVIDDDTINAFAGPGGKVYVHRGLLEKFPKDSHLAFILGHEAGHVENRDAIDRLGLQFVLGIMQVILGRTQGKLDDLLGLAAGKLYDSQVSQKAEYAADRRGVDHMYKLGYNPAESADALRRLQTEGRRRPGLLEKLFSTHPPTQERAERAEEYARTLQTN